MVFLTCYKDDLAPVRLGNHFKVFNNALVDISQ